VINERLRSLYIFAIHDQSNWWIKCFIWINYIWFIVIDWMFWNHVTRWNPVIYEIVCILFLRGSLSLNQISKCIIIELFCFLVVFFFLRYFLQIFSDILFIEIAFKICCLCCMHWLQCFDAVPITNPTPKMVNCRTWKLIRKKKILVNM